MFYKERWIIETVELELSFILYTAEDTMREQSGCEISLRDYAIEISDTQSKKML